MPKKASANQSKTPKRWEFSTIFDILEFEYEMLKEGMTTEQKELFEKSLIDPATANNKPPKYSSLKIKNFYYIVKEDRYVLIENEKDVASFMKDGEMIPAIQMFAKNNKIAKEIMSLDPIIFESKGKTPPSVPYLRVNVTSDIKGDLTSLHQIHSKVRKSR